jgi:HEPN domain-containing protein
MINNGATPVGIFLLADVYLQAARDAAGNSRSSTSGPPRLLGYHAAELFLKAYLREQGEEEDALRQYGHDLLQMLDHAIAYGLTPTNKTIERIRRASATKDYVVVRYAVVEDGRSMKWETIVSLAEDVRECVRVALGYNEFGCPWRPLQLETRPHPYGGNWPTDHLRIPQQVFLQFSGRELPEHPAAGWVKSY